MEGSLDSPQVGSSEGARVLVGFRGVDTGDINVGTLDSAAGAGVGISEGVDEISAGKSEGSKDSSVPVGSIVGWGEGPHVGITEGANVVGFHVGAADGERDISSVGKLEGVSDGLSEGTSDGASDGTSEGLTDGEVDGMA